MTTAVVLSAVLAVVAAQQACKFRPTWKLAVKCTGGYAYQEVGKGIVMACPQGASTPDALTITSESPFFAGPALGFASFIDFKTSEGSALGAKPFVAFRGKTTTGVVLEGRMEQGATRVVRVSYSKPNNASFARENEIEVLGEDDQFIVNVTRGDLGLAAGVARVEIDTLGETVKLDKVGWSIEEFAVSIVLGVENGAINSPLSVVVDAFRDADGGGSLKGDTCKAYGNETLPPTVAPTIAPTPASLAPTPAPSMCTPGTAGCCPQQQTCEPPTITCAADEVVNARRIVCGCQTDFECQKRVKGPSGGAASLAAAAAATLALLAAAASALL